jgi:hypothetical protein
MSAPPPSKAGAAIGMVACCIVFLGICVLVVACIVSGFIHAGEHRGGHAPTCQGPYSYTTEDC